MPWQQMSHICMTYWTPPHPPPSPSLGQRSSIGLIDKACWQCTYFRPFAPSDTCQKGAFAARDILEASSSELHNDFVRN